MSPLKSYDHTLYAGDKINMASTIGYAAQLGQGNMSKGEGLMIKILTIVVAIKIEIQFEEILLR